MTASSEQLRSKLAGPLAALNYEAERFVAEVKFAEGLLKLRPDKAKRWAKLIDEACRAVATAAKGGKRDRLPAAVREAEAILAPVGKVA